MQPKRTIPVIGIVLAFVFLTLHPLLAQPSTAESDSISLECMVIDEDGISFAPLILSQEDADSFFQKISQLSEELGSEESYRGLLRLITEFTESSDENSFLEQELFNTIGDLHLNLVEKRVFILSHGHGYQINPLRKFQVNLLRPSFLFWYYPGTSHHLFTTDRTIIIDPYPFHVRMFDGRQIGFMRRFIGVYVYIPATTSMESTLFFAGYAYKVIGLDLSITR